MRLVRVDLLLLISLSMSWAFWLVLHVPPYTYSSQDERDYLASLRNTPLDHPYDVANILQTVETALGTPFAFVLLGLVAY